MPQLFKEDPSNAGGRIWRRSSWGALGPGIVAVLCAIMILGTLVAASFMITSGDVAGVQNVGLLVGGLLIFEGVIGALLMLVWRDMRGKFGAMIRLTDHGITLKLRAGRSLIHHTVACDEQVAWSDVIALEKRLEAYGAQGMANMQRAYRLTRRNGEPIYLFEERGIGSNLETASMEEVADEIASRGNIRFIDKGMVRGRGGFLGAWFTAPADWSAKALSASEQSTMRRRVRLTGSILGITVLLVYLTRVLVALF